ncbi:MAG TPA: PhzF family phenazine biosynthesis protein [Ilumatobacteraceae bacterium]|nr:PhzF family phenazine biosynthesis protein [Ilumatobacteraceae bacterium]
MQRRFRQVDVFTDDPYRGNPVAVVLDGDGLTTAEMQRFANWTNLSETTFVLPPTTPEGDYRVRIFTPALELPFAGHPTLGTCHAWRESGGRPHREDAIVQECTAGMITIRPSGDRLAFAAPPLVRSGPVDEAFVVRIASALRIARADILAAEWVANGPGWVAVMLGTADEVLALKPDPIDFDLGVVGPHPPGSPHAIEVRAFFPKDGVTVEDPVTGSLNASLAQWLLGSGQLSSPYIASQGAALGRAGRVHITRDDDGTIWVGGGTVTCVSGQVEL